MSPKKTILHSLSERHQAAEGTFVRPAQIPGFSSDPERFQRAVNELLKERLIEGRKDAEGHMTVAINGHRAQDVRRVLRPVWARPAVWAAMVVVAGALGVGLVL